MDKKKRKFPTLAVILLVLGLLWLMADVGFLRMNIPWIPIVIIIIAIGMIINRYSGN
jgi:hypothetical protein